jgi:hypothetical protein
MYFKRENSLNFGESDNYSLNVLNSRFEREEAYSLVHDEYQRVGYFKAQESGMWYTIQHALAETIVLGVRDSSGQLIASLSMCINNPFGLPSERLYADEVNLIKQKCHSISEIFSVAVKNSVIGLLNRIFVLQNLFQATYWILAHLFKREKILIVVSSEHAKFYERIFGFCVFGKEKPDEIFTQPGIGLVLDLENKIRPTKALQSNSSMMINDQSTWNQNFELDCFFKYLKESVKGITKSDTDYFFIDNHEFKSRNSPERVALLEKYFKENNINN